MSVLNPTNAAPLRQLAAVRSQRAERRLDYLRGLLQELTANPLLSKLGYDMRLDDVRQPLRVVPYNRHAAESEARQRESLRESMSSLSAEREAESIHRYRGGLDEAKPDTTPRRLDDLRPRRLVLLGDPGMGKTEWLKKQAYDEARASYELLDQCGSPLDTIRLPVFARLPLLAEALVNDQEPVLGFLQDKGCVAPSLTALDDAEKFAGALLKSLWKRKLLRPELVAEMWRWLMTRPPEQAALTRLYLDSLDEVTVGHKELLEGLSAYCRHYPAAVTLTSRLMGYTTAPFEVKASFAGDALELELRPLERSDRNQFIGQFYRHAHKTDAARAVTAAVREQKGAALITELDTKATIGGMAQNPLMLTLICAAFDPQEAQPLVLPSRRGAVYDRVLRQLLARWASSQQLLDELEADSVIESMLDLLTELAYARFPTELITASDLRQFIWQGRTPYITQLDATDPLKVWLESNKTNLQVALYRTGVLTRLGGRNSYAFLHLTFQEYLTARACATRRARVDQALTKIYDPKWHEVLILLGGELET